MDAQIRARYQKADTLIYPKSTFYLLAPLSSLAKSDVDLSVIGYFNYRASVRYITRCKCNRRDIYRGTYRDLHRKDVLFIYPQAFEA